MDKEQREQARVRLESIKHEAEKIEKMLGEPETKKPRHGNVFDQHIYVKVPSWLEGRSERDEYMISPSGLLTNIKPNINLLEGLCEFNIFDDLKRNSEDLTRASIDGFVMEVVSNRIVIGGQRFLYSQAQEFHQKLGQLISTAKREQAKK